MCLKKHEYTVVLRGTSAAVLLKHDYFRVNGFPTGIGPATVAVRCRWPKHTGDVEFPGHLWIEIVGRARGLQKAIPILANAGLAILPIIAFSTNSAISDPEIELAFDSTPGGKSRQFFQSFVPPETKALRFVRTFNTELTASLFTAVAQHPQSERFRTSISQYRLALEHWTTGRETLSLAHLWMALEALTEVQLKHEYAKRELDPKTQRRELLIALGERAKRVEKMDAREEANALNARIRKDIILRGDRECYKQAKTASDGFEHGFLDFADIRDYARQARTKIANYLRQRILELLDLTTETRAALLSPPFSTPMGHWPIVRYFRGTLVGESDDLAAPESAYPYMRWAPRLRNCDVGQDGQIHIGLDDRWTGQFADGIELKDASTEVWKPD